MTPGRRKRHLEYKPCLVAYIDILGFRNLIKRESPNFISRAIRLVQEATAPDKLIKAQFREEFVNFSDLMVHTIPVSSKANLNLRAGLVFAEVLHLVHAQAALIEEGLLIRGALTFGDMEKTYGNLFGPALIAAYDLERKEARVPRIVFHDILLRELKTNDLLRRHDYKEEMEYLRRFLRKDKNGVVFVDYLGGLQFEYDSAIYLWFLNQHRELIIRGLASFEDDYDVVSKYCWLQRYHNTVVKERFPSREQQSLTI